MFVVYGHSLYGLRPLHVPKGSNGLTDYRTVYGHFDLTENGIDFNAFALTRKMALNLVKKALLYDPKILRNAAAIYYNNAVRNRK